MDGEGQASVARVLVLTLSTGHVLLIFLGLEVNMYLQRQGAKKKAKMCGYRTCFGIAHTNLFSGAKRTNICCFSSLGCYFHASREEEQTRHPPTHTNMFKRRRGWNIIVLGHLGFDCSSLICMIAESN